MALTIEQRQRVRHEIGKLLSRLREPIALTKPELQAAVDATDDWIEANATKFNAALPVAARNALTAAQKARLFMAVAKARFDG